MGNFKVCQTIARIAYAFSAYLFRFFALLFLNTYLADAFYNCACRSDWRLDKATPQ
jgi:hypothetical protein